MKKYVILSGLLLAAAFLVLCGTQRNPVEQSIVKVLNAEGTGGGTGWVAFSGGKKVVVTNHHVCAVAQGGYARVETDSGSPSLKRVLRSSPVRDLCILEGVDAPALSLAKVGPSRFEKLTSYGHPGLRPTAPAEGVYTGNGIIQLGAEAVNDQCPPGASLVESFFGNFCVFSMEIAYSTIPAMPGSSGSPIVNAEGDVVGVMNSTNAQGFQGMFIPLNYVRDILAE